MLVVKVEVWPGGVQALAQEIGRMEIENVSNLAQISDYSVSVTQLGSERLGVCPIDVAFIIEGHARENGAWALVKRVVDRL